MLQRRLIDTLAAVAKELGTTREKMKFYHDQKLHVSDLNPGKTVWIKRKWTKKGQSESLSTRWLGPWINVRKMDNGVDFELRNPKTGKTAVIHHDRIGILKKLVSIIVIWPYIVSLYCIESNS
jgi:hypothetical protein